MDEPEMSWGERAAWRNACRTFGLELWTALGRDPAQFDRLAKEQPVTEVWAVLLADVRAVRKLRVEPLLAWDTRWCPSCGARSFDEERVCCGARMDPVRIEMYERSPT